MIKGTKNTVFTQIEPPKGLFGVIFSRIERERETRTRRMALASFLGSILSLFAMFITGNYLIDAVYRSGTYDYISLIFSDFNNISYFWKEAFISIAESLPIFSMMITILALIGFLGSFKKVVENIAGGNYLKVKTI